MTYVDAGGNLLITGPVDRDEHWQIVHRAADLGLAAHVEPLTYHDATIRLGDSFHSLSHSDSSSKTGSTPCASTTPRLFKEIPHGKGRIFWTSYPVELAEDSHSTADLYAYVPARLNITPDVHPAIAASRRES